jgi:hypothetical protein
MLRYLHILVKGRGAVKESEHVIQKILARKRWLAILVFRDDLSFALSRRRIKSTKNCC